MSSGVAFASASLPSSVMASKSAGSSMVMMPDLAPMLPAWAATMLISLAVMLTDSVLSELTTEAPNSACG